MEKIREFLRSTGGRITAAAMVLIAAGAMYFSMSGFFGRSEAAGVASDRTYICAETGKPFHHTLVRGERIPVESPHSGKATGYPAELCYWTADGHVADKPTPVLLNDYTGTKGPTFCKVCGRLVVGHNPFPREGMTPPPTQSEYQATRLARRPRGPVRDPAAADSGFEER